MEDANVLQHVTVAAQHTAEAKIRELDVELTLVRQQVGDLQAKYKESSAATTAAIASVTETTAKVAGLTEERDGLVARLAKAESEVQALGIALQEKTALYTRIQVSCTVDRRCAGQS
jgi:chromosome segregation ATPase